MNTNIPIKLDNARAWRAYLGGSRLDQFHGLPGEDGHFPEEWIMSAVPARNPGREDVIDEGLSRLASDPSISLEQMIEKDPAKMLGEAHVRQFGNSMGVLVKLIDSAERLPVQGHPDRKKAKEYLNSDYGKTECWHILSESGRNGEPPYVYFGFREGVTKERWRKAFEEQNIEKILGCMHRFEVKEGDTILIEGGIPHAIGAGCFLVEIQEPTDYTFRVEKKTPRGYPLSDEMCHQGIGYDNMFECFHYGGLSREETKRRWFIKPEPVLHQEGGSIISLIGYKDTRYFAMDMMTIGKKLEVTGDGSFSGFYVLQGSGGIAAEGNEISLQRGEQFFVPAGAEKMVIYNKQAIPLKVLQCRGPKTGREEAAGHQTTDR